MRIKANKIPLINSIMRSIQNRKDRVFRYCFLFLPLLISVFIYWKWENNFVLGFAISVPLAIPFTYYWSEILLRWIKENESANKIWWMPPLIGVFERAIITTLIGGDISGSGAFVGAWVITKASQNWGSQMTNNEPDEKRKAKKRFSKNLLCSALSLSFAIAGGLIIKPPWPGQ